ncbi:hypothetical protein NKR23_g8481 [Pleurostoma richardsiae]|uniref:Stress response RCI peptide n=1 Tax=Pleurostoma richardsiae TaxID=41990 RepID=A0AA38VPF6_9PEZI|nr:hypothetical protein NKR23_g8481 [Pleurostoma richardsiae]
MCSVDIFLGLLAILFPPLPVWVKCGICSADSFINILLCVLGYLPGLLHSWYVIAKYPEPPYEYEPLHPDAEGGSRVTYVIIHEDGRRTYRDGQSQQHQSQQPKPQQPGGMDYGTTSTTNGGSSAGAASSAAAAAPAGSSSHDTAGEGSSDGAAPPSYAQVVAGDHKVQSQD